MAKFWIILASLLGATAVAVGAYHAHGLDKLIDKRFAAAVDEDGYLLADHRLYRERFDADEDKRMGPAEIEAYKEDLLHNCDVAVKYQMYHALAILGIGIICLFNAGQGGGSITLSLAAALMLLGIVGFSGGLYFVVFDLPKLHPLIIPVGGGLMILGWVMTAVAGCFGIVKP